MIVLDYKNYRIWEKQLFYFAHTYKYRSILDGDVDESNPASLEEWDNPNYTDVRNLPNEEEINYFEFSVLPKSCVTEPEKELMERRLKSNLSDKQLSEYYRRFLILSEHLRDSIPEDLQVDILHLNKPHEIFKNIASRYQEDDSLISHSHESIPKDLQAEDFHIHKPHEISNHTTFKYENIDHVAVNHNLRYLMGMKFTYGTDLTKFFAEMKGIWAKIRDPEPYRLMPVDILRCTVLLAMPKEMSDSVEIAQHLCSETNSPQNLMDELIRLYNTYHKDARNSQSSTSSSDFQSSAKCNFCLLRGVKKVNHSSDACRSSRALQDLLDPDTNSPEIPEALSHTTGTSHDPESAIFSTGVSLHITGRRDLFVDFITIPPKSIRGINGSIIQATGIGKVRFQYAVGKSIKTMELNDAYFVKDSLNTLISVSSFSRNKLSVLFAPNLNFGLLLNAKLHPLFKIPVTDGLFKIKICHLHKLVP